MTCVPDGIRATLRVTVVGVLAILGACTDGPNLPADGEPANHAPGGSSHYVYPIEGVTGSACRTNYIDDGNGGCIYAPTTGDGTGSSGGGTPTGTTSPTGTSGGSSTSPPPEGSDSTANAAAFSEGPIAWAVCILSIGGSTLSVFDVLDKFETWHGAWQDAQGAYNLWQATIQNNTDPVVQQLYEYQYKQARQRQEDAKGDVKTATNMSYVTIGFAAIACGAVALAPTP